MFHNDLIEIPFRHLYATKKNFSHYIGSYGIHHFSVIIFNPKEEMVFFSTTPSHGMEIKLSGYAEYDGIISKDFFKNFEFYWWNTTLKYPYGNKIQELREIKHELRQGFMLVRKWNGFYILYAFATKRKDIKFEIEVFNNINQLFKMGDEAYNELLSLYALYAGDIQPKKIDIFYPFMGGTPLDRYSNTKNIIQRSHIRLIINNEIILR